MSLDHGDEVQPRAYSYGTPGRKDVNGIVWWACDPYPTWYRFERDKDGKPIGDPILGPSGPWADEQTEALRDIEPWLFGISKREAYSLQRLMDRWDRELNDVLADLKKRLDEALR